MGRIGYGYGSEWQLLRYLGYHRGALNAAIIAEAAGKQVDWLDFGFADTCKPLRDDLEWKGVDAIQDPSVSAAWQKYWPTTGQPPNWDAVGRLDNHDWLLVEAKAHVGELQSRCGASPKSRVTIDAAMQQTAYPITHGRGPTDAWMNDYYQYANRLAVLNFLLSTCSPRIPARLIFIYFCCERASHKRSWNCPRSKADWLPHIANMYTALDLDTSAPMMQYVHHVFLPVNPKCCPGAAVE